MFVAMERKRRQKKLIEVASANLEAWNQRAIYWRTHEVVGCNRMADLIHYDYLKTFSEIEILSGGFQDRNIVDIGCSGGTEMDFLFLKNCRTLVGVDISRESLKAFRDKIRKKPKGKKVYLVVASAEYLPFRSEIFDYAAIFHTLHHCPSPPKVIEEIARISEETILLEPNRASVIHKIAHLLKSFRRRKFSWTNFPEDLVEFHDLGFSAKEIIDQFADLGVRRTYASTTGILPLWFPLPRLIIQILLFLERLVKKIPILKWQLGSVLVICARA